MSDTYGTQQPAPYQSTPMSAVQIWTTALVPSETSYARIVSDPGMSLGKAVLWVFLASVLSAILSYGVGLVVSTAMGALGGTNGQDLGVLLALFQTTTSGVGVLCGIPVAIIGFLIVAGLIHATARALGGTGTFTQLAYGLAALSVPMSVLYGILYPIPLINCLTLPLGLYSTVLGVLAAKAAYRFGWGQAVAAYLLLPTVLTLVVACGTIVLLALLGPAIGNVFSNIVTTLTPAP